MKTFRNLEKRDKVYCTSTTFLSESILLYVNDLNIDDISGIVLLSPFMEEESQIPFFKQAVYFNKDDLNKTVIIQNGLIFSTRKVRIEI